MSQRKIRVGELIRRELSEVLHSRWRSQSVAITLTEVDISPDLRNARVYYSVIGDREAVAKAGKFLMKIRKEIRQILSKKVILKYTPELYFIFDASVERGMRILSALDELDDEDENPQDYQSQEDDFDSYEEGEEKE